MDNAELINTYKLDVTAARKLVEEAEALNGLVAREKTQKVLAQVEQAAKQARRMVRIDMADTTELTVVIKRLKSLGYTVTHENGYDQRNGDSWSYIVVGW